MRFCFPLISPYVGVILFLFLKKAFFEPTSVPKSLKLFEHPDTVFAGSVRYASPNEYELEAMSIEAAKQFSTIRDVNETFDQTSINWDGKLLSNFFEYSGYIRIDSERRCTVFS